MPRILVIEDDQDSRKLLVSLLHKAGYATDQAKNGRQAISMLRSESPPNLVLTDLIMPEEDGLGVIMMLRQDMPNLPVIAMSGGQVNGSFYLDVAKKLGAKKLLSKPFTAQQLFEAVRDVLPTEITPVEEAESWKSALATSIS